VYFNAPGTKRVRVEGERGDEQRVLSFSRPGVFFESARSLVSVAVAAGAGKRRGLRPGKNKGGFFVKWTQRGWGGEKRKGGLFVL
jgi:hypothetical protein